MEVEEIAFVLVEKVWIQRVRYRISQERPWFFYQLKQQSKESAIIEYYTDETWSSQCAVPSEVTLELIESDEREDFFYRPGKLITEEYVIYSSHAYKMCYAGEIVAMYNKYRSDGTKACFY